MLRKLGRDVVDVYGDGSDSTRQPSAARARALVGLLAAAVLMAGAALPAAASAASAPIALDAPDNGNAPQVAYDPTSQTTYVAWTDPTDTAIDLCVLPSGATACEDGVQLLTDTSYAGYSTSNYATIGGIVVLPSGSTVVLGAPVSTGTIAWESAAGGAAFLTATGNHGLQNGGAFISPVSLYRTPGNAVALSGTNVGLLDDYGNFFSDSPFAGPVSTDHATNPGGQYPRKAEDTNGPEIGAEAAPAPDATGTEIVVGVGSNNSSTQTTPSGCVNDAASGYGVSVGNAATLNGDGLPAYQLLACAAEAPVLASGGTDGIGVLEQEGSGVSGAGSDYTLDYRPFDGTATGGTFGAPVELADVTSHVLDGVDALDLSDDSGTGVYALWEDGQGSVLDYSANGGATWAGPVVTPVPYNGDTVITGTGSGNAEIAYDMNPGTGDQVYLQAVNYQSLVPPAPTPTPTPTAIETAQDASATGTSVGADISIPAGTVGEIDQAIITGANAASATGTMSYALYSNSSCSGSSLAFNGGLKSVTNAVAPASNGVSTVLAAGTYYWQAVYSGNATNDPSASACGSEVLTVTPTATIGGSGSSNGTTVTISITCAVVPCTVTVTITIDPPATMTTRVTADKKKKPKAKTITLGSGTFKIKKKGADKLAVKLSKAGKKYLSTHHGRASGAKLLVSTKIDGHLEKTSRTISITTHKPKKHK